MHHLQPSPFRSILLHVLALLVLLAGWNVYQYALYTIHTQQSNCVLTLFMKGTTDYSEVARIQRNIQELSTVMSVETTLPDKAKEQFSLRFGAPSDTLLPVNPFPITFVVRFRQEPHSILDFTALRGMSEILSQRNITNMLTEHRADMALIDHIQQDMHSLQRAVPILIIVVLCVVVFLLISASRAIMLLLRDEAYILNVFGAQSWIIIRPHLASLMIYAVSGVIIGSILALLGIQVLRSLGKQGTYDLFTELMNTQTLWNDYTFVIIATMSSSVLLLTASIGMLLGIHYTRRYGRL